ncbi:MAG: sugar transferase [Patescibacteria group bacterium]
MRTIQTIIYKIFIFCLLLISLPMMLVIAILIAIFTGLPILYQQKRVGKSGMPFVLYKFRTMVRDADSFKKNLLHKNEASGPVFKMFGDPRFTPLGKSLSHMGLDELPQLFNILKGEMALIGPRPLPLNEATKLTITQKKRQQIKPGIISSWIIEGYHTQTFNNWMISDLNYIRQKSLSYDTVLLLKAVVFLGSLILREVRRILGFSRLRVY